MSSMKNFPIPKSIKIRCLEYNMTQIDMAKIISENTGKFLSPKRLNDMIHGLRQGEWEKYHLEVAKILNFQPAEIRDPTKNPSRPLP